MSDWVPWYIATFQIDNRSSYQIQTTITFYSDVRLSPVIYWDAPNWKWKFVANSNDNNFYSDVRLSTVIYRDAPNWEHKLWGISKDNNFILGCSIESRNISRFSKFKMDACSKFKRDAPNWKRKLVANSNDNNFLLGCSIESRNISTGSKLRTEALCNFKRQ